jgi:hypothetical protein
MLIKIYSFHGGKMAQVTLPTYIGEVPVEILAMLPNIQNLTFHRFPQFLQANAGESTSNYVMTASYHKLSDSLFTNHPII